ncbi:MAG: hypothetical protein P4L36_22095 [Holophaga sp.]|nr:hypothetical protein [Holophaga sp.]
MSILKALLLVSVCTLAAAPSKTPVAPLQPGEALALCGPDGVPFLFGDATRESPMGCLADLVWLKLEGSEWGAMNVQFNCTGMFQGYACWRPKGHGRVDLAKALQENCDLAFLIWGKVSVQWWLRDYGEGAARARLEDIFGPFLGNRLPPGNDLPAIEPPWVGNGDLLRTSPEAMLHWLSDPAQDETLRLARRLLLSFRSANYKENMWWVETGTAPEGKAAASAWAVGGNGQVLAVLHLPQGKGKADALARFRAILQVPKDK